MRRPQGASRSESGKCERFSGEVKREIDNVSGICDKPALHCSLGGVHSFDAFGLCRPLVEFKIKRDHATVSDYELFRFLNGGEKPAVVSDRDRSAVVFGKRLERHKLDFFECGGFLQQEVFNTAINKLARDSRYRFDISGDYRVGRDLMRGFFPVREAPRERFHAGFPLECASVLFASANCDRWNIERCKHLCVRARHSASYDEEYGGHVKGKSTSDTSPWALRNERTGLRIFKCTFADSPYVGRSHLPAERISSTSGPVMSLW